MQSCILVYSSIQCNICDRDSFVTEIHPIHCTVENKFAHTNLESKFTQILHLRYTSKRMQQFVKFVFHFDKKSRRTFMVCAGSTGIQNCGAFCRTRSDFCQTRHNSVNAPHFHGKRCHNPRDAAILGLQRLTRRHTAVQPSKCGTFGGRKAAHMPQCFQVPRRHVCCIL